MRASPLDTVIDRALAEDVDRWETLWAIVGWVREQENRTKLGRVQRGILAEASKGERVRWCPKPKSDAEAKALSRALRDLERRGLLERLGRDGKPGLPTYWIRLTPRGREAYQERVAA